MLSVVILTKDEEQHIARAIESVSEVATSCLVVDSGSSDRTVEIARDNGATVLIHPFVTHAQQFNWAIDQLSASTEWILRLDADEIVTKALAEEITGTLPNVGAAVEGVYVSRRMTFLGRPIRWGGVFPIRVLRLFRHGKGRCEDRWMDEHIMVRGGTLSLSGEIIDDNLNSLTWWTEKHNSYASREVVDLFNTEYRLMPRDTTTGLSKGTHARLRRWLKERLYGRLPGGVRAFAYFIYRYFVRLGVLDGREGLIFHGLQGFWYRFLVDAKQYEVRKFMVKTDSDAVTAIYHVLGIDLSEVAHSSQNELIFERRE